MDGITGSNGNNINIYTNTCRNKNPYQNGSNLSASNTAKSPKTKNIIQVDKVLESSIERSSINQQTSSNVSQRRTSLRRPTSIIQNTQELDTDNEPLAELQKRITRQKSISKPTSSNYHVGFIHEENENNECFGRCSGTDSICGQRLSPDSRAKRMFRAGMFMCYIPAIRNTSKDKEYEIKEKIVETIKPKSIITYWKNSRQESAKRKALQGMLKIKNENLVQLKTIAECFESETTLNELVSKLESTQSENMSHIVANSYSAGSEYVRVIGSSYGGKSAKYVYKIHQNQGKVLHSIYKLLQIRIKSSLWANRNFKEYLPDVGIFKKGNTVYNEKILYAAQSVISGFTIKGISTTGKNIKTSAIEMCKVLELLRKTLFILGKTLISFSVDPTKPIPINQTNLGILKTQQNNLSLTNITKEINEITPESMDSTTSCSNGIKGVSLWNVLCSYTNSGGMEKSNELVTKSKDGSNHLELKNLINGLEEIALQLLISFDKAWIKFEQEISFTYFSEGTENTCVFGNRIQQWDSVINPRIYNMKTGTNNKYHSIGSRRNSDVLDFGLNIDFDSNSSDSDSSLNVFGIVRNTSLNFDQIMGNMNFTAKRKNPNSEESAFMVVLLSEAWIFSVKNNVLDTEKLSEMDIDAIVSLPRVSVVLEIFNSITEYLDLILEKLDSIDIAKKKVFLVEGKTSILQSENVSFNQYSKTNPKMNQTYETRNNTTELNRECNTTKKNCVSLMKYIKQQLRNKSLKIEKLWWFYEFKQSINNIKNDIVEGSVNHFIEKHLNKVEFSDGKEVIRMYKEVLRDYFIQVCKAIVSNSNGINESSYCGDVDKKDEGVFKTNTSDNRLNERYKSNTAEFFNLTRNEKFKTECHDLKNIGMDTYIENKSLENSTNSKTGLETKSTDIISNNSITGGSEIQTPQLLYNIEPNFANKEESNESIVSATSVNLMVFGRLDSRKSIWYRDVKKSFKSFKLVKSKSAGCVDKVGNDYFSHLKVEEKETRDIEYIIDRKEIQTMFINVCKVADQLQTGRCAKPFRGVLQSVHKMNTSI
ncbi:hypothetical protein BB558_004722 [Smittium angustum]|uniref:Uncharacterized protein n=1 Tax=Smittium angustum TaxID=133377 RepID=A0A2U1J2H0_SMIAN|nr:hypothetical protein BB558_004722 [Smittium angustum]